MAIEDIAEFEDIEILQNCEGENLSGGILRNWGVLETIQGRINQRYSNVNYSAGKRGEQSEYIGYFEYSEDNLNYIDTKGIRFKTQDGYIYKKKGKCKNTMGKGHHIRVDLEYVDYVRE